MASGMLTWMFLGWMHLIFPCHSSEAIHDLHVCLGEVAWNADRATVEVSLKIFIDDLETSLTRQQFEGLHIGTPKESGEADHIIADYLDQHFQVKMDGIRLPAGYLGKEVAEDYQAIWCYVEYPGVKTPKSFSVSNDILFEVFSDQRNIMNFEMAKGKKDYAILEPRKSTWSFTF